MGMEGEKEEGGVAKAVRVQEGLGGAGVEGMEAMVGLERLWTEGTEREDPAAVAETVAQRVVRGLCRSPCRAGWRKSDLRERDCQTDRLTHSSCNCSSTQSTY